jgi:hypothetical protein
MNARTQNFTSAADLLKGHAFECDGCGKEFTLESRGAALRFFGFVEAYCEACNTRDFEFNAVRFVTQKLAGEFNCKLVEEPDALHEFVGGGIALLKDEKSASALSDHLEKLGVQTLVIPGEGRVCVSPEHAGILEVALERLRS